jgi:hypothetical protein
MIAPHLYRESTIAVTSLMAEINTTQEDTTTLYLSGTFPETD